VTDHPDLSRTDGASAAERRQALEHIARCERCRARWTADDPSRVFALLAIAPIPAVTVEQVSLERIEKTPPPRRAFKVVAVWAAAACLGLAMLVSALRPGPSPAVHVADRKMGRAGVEVLEPRDGARVVDLTVGETQVVMVFDERLNL
jgi:anti-sigma factor RsiW